MTREYIVNDFISPDGINVAIDFVPDGFKPEGGWFKVREVTDEDPVEILLLGVWRAINILDNDLHACRAINARAELQELIDTYGEPADDGDSPLPLAKQYRQDAEALTERHDKEMGIPMKSKTPAEVRGDE